MIKQLLIRLFGVEPSPNQVLITNLNDSLSRMGYTAVECENVHTFISASMRQDRCCDLEHAGILQALCSMISNGTLSREDAYTLHTYLPSMTVGLCAHFRLSSSEFRKRCEARALSSGAVIRYMVNVKVIKL